MPPVSGSFSRRPFAVFSAVVLATTCVLSVTGCGMGTTAAPDPVQVALSGRVHGGQQAVVGAQIQLYAAFPCQNNDGTTSTTASCALLDSPVTSGPDGGFTITGDYTCPSANSQVYLVATQGNPGLGSGGNNPALAMVAALGNCGNLSPSQFIWINEITTVAAAWTLAPFETDIAHIGASSTNATGLGNAFLNAQLIANTANGTVATLPSNLTTEPGKINALADAMASCINSDGTTGCSPFLTAATPPGGSAPTNTWDAAVNIVRNPGNNVGGVYAAMGATPPFSSSLTQAPNDWTLSLTVTGGGVSSPESLGVDSEGNIWVADYNGLLSAFNAQGTPLSSSGYGGGFLGEDFGLAIDGWDNIWVTIEELPAHNSTKGSVVKFAGVNSSQALGTYTLFSDDSINFPYAVAADWNGTIFLANYSLSGSSTNLVELQPNGPTYTAISTGSAVGFPVALAVDTAHGVWIAGTDAGSSASVAHVDSTGTVVFSTDCCGPVVAVALDTSGNVWMADSEDSDENGDSGGAVTQLGPDGSTLHEFITGGGITNPSHIAIDAADHVWVSNLHTNSTTTEYESFSEIAGSGTNSGTAISPSTGYGLDADLLVPYALAVDPSGNVWVSNTGGDSLVMFFGLAAPTKTPLIIKPEAP